MNGIDGERTDLLIIGGGLAGICAALAAAEAGATVTIAEKTSVLRGNVVWSTGSYVFSGTDLQAEAGIDDSPDELRKDLIRVGGGFADTTLIDVFVQEQLDTYNWLRSFGVEFTSVTLSSNQSRPRSHSGNVWSSTERLVRAVEANPLITTLTEHAAVRLVSEGDRVVGARFSTPTGERTVIGEAGVLIATGGFGWSREVIGTYAPRFVNAIPLGNPESTGDGLRMAMERGADLADMGFITGTFGTSAPRAGEASDPILLIAMYRGAIIVNGAGRRFANESISYKVIADLCLAEEGGTGFQVFDDRVMQQTNPEKSANDFAGALERGYVFRADTLEELATKMHVDPETFVQTVHSYNAAVHLQEVDEFGRTSLASGWGEPTPVDAPPFFAYPCTVGLPSTYGGVRVDRDMRVLNVWREPIEGLYAAGEVVGGFHGQGYISGTSLSKSVIFGRVAGREIARRLERVEA